MEARLGANECPKSKLDDFNIWGGLGRGGCATVVRVEHIRNEKFYALKVVRKSPHDEKKNLRIVSEKKLIYAMQFKFINKLHFVFQDTAYFYLVLDSALYGDLHRCINDYNLSERGKKWCAVQIILALEYMHECDILHRDLKPGNILIFEDGFLKVSDFGFSKVVKDTTLTVLGTRPYMAPEIHQSTGYGKSVDWWAFGVVLYEMMYRQRPFPRNDPFDPWDFPRNTDRKNRVCNLITRLLEIQINQRLGCLEGGVKDIMKHDWFDDISFCDVYAKNLRLELNLTPIEPREDETYEFLGETGQHPGFKWYHSFCEE